MRRGHLHFLHRLACLLLVDGRRSQLKHIICVLILHIIWKRRCCAARLQLRERRDAAQQAHEERSLHSLGDDGERWHVDEQRVPPRVRGVLLLGQEVNVVADKASCMRRQLQSTTISEAGSGGLNRQAAHRLTPQHSIRTWIVRDAHIESTF